MISYHQSFVFFFFLEILYQYIVYNMKYTRNSRNKNKKSRNRNKKSRNIKNRANKTRKSGAGIFSFGKEVANNIVFDEIKPKNLEKDTTYNKTYETIVTPDSGKEYKVFFITPQTFIFNNINATRVPTFIINNEIQNLKIKNRYVNYLVRIEGIWYAILRIVFALNTGFFGSYTWTIFYKMNNGVIQFDENTNNITIGIFHYIKQDEITLGIFKDKKETLVLKDTTYEAITDKNDDIFLALRKFRNVQLGSFALKQGAVDSAVDVGIDTIF